MKTRKTVLYFAPTMERNIKLIVEYEGTAYHGWQWQENAPTVQGVLEAAIRKLTGEKLRVTAAGRTDAGVHAWGQVVNFKTHTALPVYKIMMGLNAHLPRDVRVRQADEADLEFSARFSAKQRVYQYYISTENTAIYRNFCWQLFQKFDPELLNPVAESLLGEHDFGAFSRVQVDTAHKRCRVEESRWFRQNGLWVYRVAANRFLHGMVRTIVGTTIDVARGRFTMEEFQEIFNSRKRELAGAAAPAKGLFFQEVIY